MPLLVNPDDNAFLETASIIYSKYDRYPEALALAVRLNNPELIRKYYEAPTNPYVQHICRPRAHADNYVV